MPFLVYQLKVALLFLALYIFFRLFLSKGSFHAFNRAVVLLSILLSLVLPFCVVTLHVSAAASPVQVPGLSEFVPSVQESSGFDWAALLIAVYITGAATVLLSVAASVISLLKLVSRGRKIRRKDGTVLVLVDSAVTPMSWMNYMIMPAADSEAVSESIIVHERAHIRLHHSFDILFADLFTAMQWFNPAAWMMREDLRSIHEYEADEQVLKSGIDAKQYQLLLVKKAFGANGRSVSNNFNHGKLKKRIAMMLMKKSSAFKALKFLYVVPLVCLSLAVNARTVYKEPVRVTGSYTLNGNISVNVAGDSSSVSSFMPENVKIYIDGKLVSNEEMQALDPEKISLVNVIRTGEESAIQIFTEDAEAADGAGKNLHIEILSTDGPEQKHEADSGRVLVISKIDGDKVDIAESGQASVWIAEERGLSFMGEGSRDIYVDGKKVSEEDLENMSPDNVESVSVSKSESHATVEIVTKK